MILAKTVKFREERFGGVLFETRSEKVYSFNATAAAVVRELQSGCVPEEVGARLAAQFEDPAGMLEKDVGALISDLQGKGLLQGTAG